MTRRRSKQRFYLSPPFVASAAGGVGLVLLLISKRAYARARPEPDEPSYDATAESETPPPDVPPPFRSLGHFTVTEFDQPARRGFNHVPYPTAWIDERLRALITVLEILKATLGGRAVTVTSGYRSPAYNRVIGGATHSQHMQGRAADIKVFGVKPSVVHDTLLQLHRQGLVRLGGLGRYATFTHVDVRPGPLRQWG